MLLLEEVFSSIMCMVCMEIFSRITLNIGSGLILGPFFYGLQMVSVMLCELR